jgi:hypothetical protein
MVSALRRSTRLCIAAGVLLQPLAVQFSYAAEWSMASSVAVRTEYDDNIRFTTAPHSAVWGVLLAPEMKFTGKTETLDVTGGLRVSVNRYPGERELDSTDHAATLRSSYKSERDLLGLSIDSIRDSTLVSELLETGVVEARRQRNRLTVNPSWSRYITESTAITASYGYTGVGYGDTSGTSLIDYRDQTATVGALLNLSERDVLNVAAYYDEFETQPKTFKADTYGVQLRYDRAFSETLHASLAVGARNTRSTLSAQGLVCDGPVLFGLCFGNLTTFSAVRSERSAGYTFLGSVEKKFETGLLTARVSRELNPTGVGALVQTDRFGVAWMQQLSPTLSAFVDGSIYRSRYVGSFVTASNSRYFRIEPRVTWRLTDSWTLVGGYSYSHVRYENTSVAASANVVYAVLSYTWPRFAVSR